VISHPFEPQVVPARFAGLMDAAVHAGRVMVARYATISVVSVSKIPAYQTPAQIPWDRSVVMMRQ
jgi:hypothetical protein